MANLMPRCELCMFARKRCKESPFECRAKPPSIVPETGDEEAAHWYGVWPVVEDFDWCGCFAQHLPPETPIYRERNHEDVFSFEDEERPEVGDLHQSEENNNLYIFTSGGFWRKVEREN